MSRYAGGDMGAFDALYAQISPRVFRYLFSMTRDRGVAEDLFQTVFLKVHRSRAGWIPGSNVVAWFMAIARNTFYDDALQRRRDRARVTEGGDVPDVVGLIDLEALLTAPPDAPSPSLLAALARAVDALPERSREALILTKRSGLSQKEAALVLGTTTAAVKLRVHRAYEELRDALGSHPEVARSRGVS